MRRILKVVPSLLLPLALAGCFSIGNDGSSGLNPITFSGFSNLKESSTTKVGGIGNEIAYASDGSKVTSLGNLETGKNLTVGVTLDENKKITEVKVSGPKTVSTWTGILNDPDNPKEVLIARTDGNKDSVYMMPLNSGYEYQTFGVWQTGTGTASGTSGAFSVGSKMTDVALAALKPVQDDPSVPSDPDMASFRGNALGSYVDENGRQYVTSAQADLTVDLAGQSGSFQTTHTAAVPLAGGGSNAAPGLDLNGTLAWGATNAISGTVTSGSQMHGTVNGAFYGPAGSEIGGVYALKGTGTQAYVGGFGATKQ